MISSLLGLFEEKHHQHFDDHGYVIMGSLLSGGELLRLKRRAEDLMMGHLGKLQGTYRAKMDIFSFR